MRDRTRLKLTLRAKRLGLSLTEARDIIETYDSPRDTGAQLSKFLEVLARHRKQIEEQMADLKANLDEIKVHQREARALLAKQQAPAAANTSRKTTKKPAKTKTSTPNPQPPKTRHQTRKNQHKNKHSQEDETCPLKCRQPPSLLTPHSSLSPTPQSMQPKEPPHEHARP